MRFLFFKQKVNNRPFCTNCAPNPYKAIIIINCPDTFPKTFLKRYCWKISAAKGKSTVIGPLIKFKLISILNVVSV